LRFIVVVVSVGGGRRGVWREDLSLFEKPFDGRGVAKACCCRRL
jgi:hypothetical protein